MKLLAWLKQFFVKDLAEKPTPLNKLTELTSGDLVVKNVIERKRPNREEYMKWCKERAKEYIAKGDLKNALSSFYSDMRKHPETKDHPYLRIGMQIELKSQEEVEEFINGFQ